jgi:hypothetical protein
MLNLLLLPYALYRSLTGQGRTSFEIEQWAEECDTEVASLEPCGVPPYSVQRYFPFRARAGEFRYFRITVIDQDHVRRSGVARVNNEIRPWSDTQRVVDVVWLASEQLNWRDRPPRRWAKSPHDRAQGWYCDHTGDHELRWYSAGTPTGLVKDGETESRDLPG